MNTRSIGQAPEYVPQRGQPFRFYDPKHAQTMVRIGPGEYHMSVSADEAIHTTLGSCVAVCIHDPSIHIGGMNHFMLPGPGDESSPVSRSDCYGVFAMESLLNEYAKRGGSRRRIEIKVTGGASVGSGLSTVGKSNADFILRFLRAERLPTIAADLGGQQPRRVQFEPATGRLRVRRLPIIDFPSVLEKEESFRASMVMHPATGTAELFGEWHKGKSK